MLKIRSPWAIGSDRTSSENVIVATPLGPNQAMKRLRRACRCPVPASASQIATGRATSSVTTTIATAAQPSSNRPWKRQQRAEDDEDAELDDLDDVLGAGGDVGADVGPADAEHDRRRRTRR